MSAWETELHDQSAYWRDAEALRLALLAWRMTIGKRVWTQGDPALGTPSLSTRHGAVLRCYLEGSEIL